ncbi:MAG: hypothetical protein ACIWVG_19915 [Gloeotrichia echinulata HAB0833]
MEQETPSLEQETPSLEQETPSLEQETPSSVVCRVRQTGEFSDKMTNFSLLTHRTLSYSRKGAKKE